MSDSLQNVEIAGWMGCEAPRGSLRLDHLAAKLNPTIFGGPKVLVSLPMKVPTMRAVHVQSNQAKLC